MAQIQTGEHKYAEADRTYQRAAMIQDIMIGNADSTLGKTALVKAASDLYAKHFALVAEHIGDTEKAFGIIEQVRGRVMTDPLMAGVNTSSESFDAEKRIVHLRLKLMAARSDGDIRQLRDEIFLAEQFRSITPEAIKSLKVQGCDRLMIDLRGCLGGSLGFARLVSYLCPDRIPIGYDVTRKRLQRGYNVAEFPRVRTPSTKLGLLFCLARAFRYKTKSLVLLTQGLGKQPFHGRVVVMVNEWTNSAGEMAAQFSKDTKLATVVDKQTRGNVLGSKMFNVENGYQLYLPIFGWYSPAGNCTEGLGVLPDLAVDIDPDSLTYGNDAQVNKTLELLQ